MTEEMCRLCLDRTNLQPLFGNQASIGQESHSLLLVTGLDIRVMDGLPQQICQRCIQSMHIAINLRNTSRAAEKTLLSMGLRRMEFDTKNIKKEERSDYSVDSLDVDFDCVSDPEESQSQTEPDKTEKKIKVDNEASLTLLKDILNGEPTENKRTHDKTTLVSDILKTEVKVVRERKKDKYLLSGDVAHVVRSSTLKSSFLKDILNGEPTENKRTHDKTTLVSDILKTEVKVVRERKKAVYKPKKQPKGPFKCDTCFKIIETWGAFKYHKNVHNSGAKFICEHCGRKFNNKSHIERHCMSQHGLERTLMCSYCDFKAIDTTQLTHHLRREHTGERPYICDHCGASYYGRRYLIQHMDSHITKAEVQCPICLTFFRSKRHLARHTFVVHTSKNFLYKCPICFNTYKGRNFARVHLKRVHNTTTATHDLIKIKL